MPKTTPPKDTRDPVEKIRDAKEQIQYYQGLKKDCDSKGAERFMFFECVQTTIDGLRQTVRELESGIRKNHARK